MFGYSLAASNRQADLGYDISQYRITKMYTDDESIRIVGTQEGEIFAFDTEGALLWNVGKPIARAVYDIGMEEGRVYVIYADGQILAFSAEEASEYNGTADESFLGQCVVYSVGVSFADDGNVSNTQLLVSGDDYLLLRGKFRGAPARSNIFKIDLSSGEVEPLLGSNGTSKKVGGMALWGNSLYYAQDKQISVQDLQSGSLQTVASLTDNIVALSVSEDRINAVTENNNITAIDRNSYGIIQTRTLGVTLSGNLVYSTGRNFVGKIQNGGVAVVDAEGMEVVIRMNASDKANLIMWTDESFVLKDDTDVNNPSVALYSVDLAQSVSLFSKLVYVFLALLIVSLLAGLYLGFGISDAYRARINAKFRAFFRALRKDKLVYLSMVIPVALLIVFYYIPIVLSLGLAFFDYVPGQTMVFSGMKNIIAVVSDTRFWNSAVTMLIFLVADLLKAIIPPILIAEAIFAVKFRRFSLWTRILLFLPAVLPGVATIMVWKDGVFGSTSNSLVNAFIGLFVPGFVKNWINSAQISTQIFSLISFGFPWVGSYLIFYGAISGINSSVFESAKLDGCGWIKRIVKMDIPLILPQIKYIFITSFIASVQNYTVFYVIYDFTGAIQTPALLMYREIINANYGTASVMGLLIFIFLSVATVLNFRMQSDQS